MAWPRDLAELLDVNADRHSSAAAAPPADRPPNGGYAGRSSR